MFQARALSSSKSLHLLKTALSILRFAQEKFDRSAEVDEASMKHFISSTLRSSYPPPLTDNERHLLTEWRAFDANEFVSQQFKRIKGTLSSSPTVSKFVRQVGTDEGAFCGKAVGTIDASAETVIAWFWLSMSNERVKGFHAENGYLLRSSINIPRSRSKILSTSRRMPTGFQNRFYNTWSVWDKSVNRDKEDVYFLAYAPSDECTALVPEIATTPGFLKGSSRGYYKIEALTLNICVVSMVQSTSAGGSIPTWIVSLHTSKTLHSIERLQDKYRREGKMVDKVRVRLDISFIISSRTSFF